MQIVHEKITDGIRFHASSAEETISLFLWFQTVLSQLENNGLDCSEMIGSSTVVGERRLHIVQAAIEKGQATGSQRVLFQLPLTRTLHLEHFMQPSFIESIRHVDGLWRYLNISR